MTEPSPKSKKLSLRRSLQAVAGTSALIIGLLSLLLPSPYLVETPGPIFNTIGEIEDQAVISVTGEQTYPTDGELNLTTVYVAGAPTSTVRVPEAVLGWLNPRTDMQPHELIYPSGTTAEQVQQQNTAAMTSSQDLAVAAALNELDIEYTQELSVIDFTEEAVEVGTDDQLEPGDRVLAAAGSSITGLEGLRDAVNTAAGQPVALTVLRDGEEIDYEVPTYQETDGDYYVGIMLENQFSFPVDVQIQLDGVGGPSAGLMFTLGLVDEMTEGSMTGGKNWAGTGTVDPDGTVGPIGGIAQKVIGARSQGIENFLVPSANCADLRGRVPDGLTTYAVDNVSQGREIVEAVRDADEDFLAGLESCGS